MGFQDEITEILRMAPKKRQTMLFRCALLDRDFRMGMLCTSNSGLGWDQLYGNLGCGRQVTYMVSEWARLGATGYPT
jgi:hypothetical protein